MMYFMRKGLCILEQFSRINHDIGIIGGKACITGTRTTVSMILMKISEGTTVNELLAEYQNLTAEDISEALRYAAWAIGTREALIVPE